MLPVFDGGAKKSSTKRVRSHRALAGPYERKYSLQPHDQFCKELGNDQATNDLTQIYI